MLKGLKDMGRRQRVKFPTPAPVLYALFLQGGSEHNLEPFLSLPGNQLDDTAQDSLSILTRSNIDVKDNS